MTNATRIRANRAVKARWERRLVETCGGLDQFTSDDLTGCGQYVADPAHAANAGNNRIGALFNGWSKRGLIEKSGDYIASQAPHRKGGAIAVWRWTAVGRLWCRTIAADPS